MGVRSRHPLRPVWAAMKVRCSNPDAWNYKYYGALGVRVCPEWWNSFEQFLKDMGERPGTGKEWTLDRIDVTGNYEPDNCRWATWKQQAANKRLKPVA